eukprot:SAG22_NODE_6_length_41368_cov_49.702222_11_plen_132_part_00
MCFPAFPCGSTATDRLDSLAGLQSLGKADHETPFGQIVENVDIIDKFNDHPYGDSAGQLQVSHKALPLSCVSTAFLSKTVACHAVLHNTQGALMGRGNAAAGQYPELARFKTCYRLPAATGQPPADGKAEL